MTKVVMARTLVEMKDDGYALLPTMVQMSVEKLVAMLAQHWVVQWVVLWVSKKDESLVGWLVDLWVSTRDVKLDDWLVDLLVEQMVSKMDVKSDY